VTAPFGRRQGWMLPFERGTVEHPINWSETSSRVRGAKKKEGLSG